MTAESVTLGHLGLEARWQPSADVLHLHLHSTTGDGPKPSTGLVHYSSGGRGSTWDCCLSQLSMLDSWVTDLGGSGTGIFVKTRLFPVLDELMHRAPWALD